MKKNQDKMWKISETRVHQNRYHRHQNGDLSFHQVCNLAHRNLIYVCCNLISVCDCNNFNLKCKQCLDAKWFCKLAWLHTFTITAVYAKPRLSQVNVRQIVSATGRNLGLPVTMSGNFCQILLYVQWCDRS